jgi:hypothetical protein
MYVIGIVSQDTLIKKNKSFELNKLIESNEIFLIDAIDMDK